MIFYKIERSISDILQYIINVFAGIILLIIGVIFILNNYFFSSIIVIFLSIKVFFFKHLDLIFNILLFQKNDNDLYIKAFGITNNVNLNKAFLIIRENEWYDTSSNQKKYYLIIVRNEPSISKRIFKNKIKLMYDVDINKLNQVGKTISSMFDLPFYC